MKVSTLRKLAHFVTLAVVMLTRAVIYFFHVPILWHGSLGPPAAQTNNPAMGLSQVDTQFCVFAQGVRFTGTRHGRRVKFPS